MANSYKLRRIARTKVRQKFYRNRQKAGNDISVSQELIDKTQKAVREYLESMQEMEDTLAMVAQAQVNANNKFDELRQCFYLAMDENNGEAVMKIDGVNWKDVANAGDYWGYHRNAEHQPGKVYQDFKKDADRYAKPLEDAI